MNDAKNAPYFITFKWSVTLLYRIQLKGNMYEMRLIMATIIT